jgi:K+-transporting ATPase KdpF subunit
MLRGGLRVALDAGEGVSAGDAFGLAISIAVLVYLVYALVRGEKL